MSLKIAQSLLLDSFNSSSVELDDTFLVSDNLNLSITSNNISNNETFGEDYTRTEKVFWALLLIPLPLVAVIGNILVILSVYKERSLQTVTNYFIVSLAFADLLVAAVVMPFAVYVLFCNARKGGNRLVRGTDYMLDALKPSNKAPRFSGESLQTYMAWCCPDGTHLFCWPFLAVSSQSQVSNGPVIDSNYLNLVISPTEATNSK
ncbi:hypothetical protein TNCV_3617981 [Trichonephila clavipes]|nr:hypothetical protein TNCV_3617981 [Trichonephila clavipes]